MKKYYIILGIASAIIISVAFFGRSYEFDARTEAERIKCIEQFGWKIEGGAIETEKVAIPSPLGAVYEEYNTLQQKIGLDLANHTGQHATRYTYIVKNRSDAKGRQIRANILVADGKMIAGDIMVTALDGYMIPMNGRLK
ncbi:MAG: DUF4830 domain-containing protein [Clostridia bacterium]|nr:DUF4830 domain-containing protein [Clostridia bacterium]